MRYHLDTLLVLDTQDMDNLCVHIYTKQITNSPEMSHSLPTTLPHSPNVTRNKNREKTLHHLHHKKVLDFFQTWTSKYDKLHLHSLSTIPSHWTLELQCKNNHDYIFHFLCCLWEKEVAGSLVFTVQHTFKDSLKPPALLMQILFLSFCFEMFTSFSHLEAKPNL